MLIDSHCHFDYFTEAERPGLLARAHQAGVARMVTIGTRLSRAAEQIALAESGPNIWCTVGTHPHHAAEEELPQEQEIAALASHPKVIGVGEGAWPQGVLPWNQIIASGRSAGPPSIPENVPYSVPPAETQVISAPSSAERNTPSISVALSPSQGVSSEERFSCGRVIHSPASSRCRRAEADR